MAINNPYIPGDPFSYDLKWIVRQLKNAASQLEEFKKIIEDLPQQQRATQFNVDTVADMLLLDLEVGDVITTKGYYSAGDDGACTYTIINDPLLYPYYVTVDTGLYAVPIILGAYVVPEMFGAKADNVTDDAQALLFAAAWAAAYGKTLATTPGKDYLIDQDIDLKGVNVLDFKGAINNVGHLLTFGPEDLAGRPDNYHIDRVEGNLRMKGGSNAHVYVGYADTFELWADSAEHNSRYVSYCTFIFGYVREFYIHAYHSGWINENKIFGLRVVKVEMDGDTNPNNNSFYGSKIEGETFNIVKGYSNHFYDLRCESSVALVFGKETHDNIVEISWNQYPRAIRSRAASDLHPIPIAPRITDNGTDNIFAYPQNAYYDTSVIFDLAGGLDPALVTRNKNGTMTLQQNKVLYKSDAIRVTEPLGLFIRSDRSNFRMFVYLYDDNGSAVTADVSQYVYTDLSYNASGYYQNSTGLGMDRSAPYFTIDPNPYVTNVVVEIKTVTYTPDSWTVEFMKLCMTKNAHRFISHPTTGRFSSWHSSAAPASGYWYAGDVVMNTNTATGQPVGWICTAEGLPGTWKALPAYA